MSRRNGDVSLYTTVNDELYDTIAEFCGERLVHVVVWDETLSDELAGNETDDDEQILFDIDLYLENGVYFELYSTALFDDPQGAEMQGGDHASRTLMSQVNQGGKLIDVAVDEADQLVLLIGSDANQSLYLAVGGWLLEEWDELPA